MRRGYTDLEKETIGLEVVRYVLGGSATEIVDLRAQHGFGANAADQLRRFYELKVSASAEPDEIVLEDSQIRRALSTKDFFLVIAAALAHVASLHTRLSTAGLWDFCREVGVPFKRIADAVPVDGQS